MAKTIEKIILGMALTTMIGCETNSDKTESCTIEDKSRDGCYKKEGGEYTYLCRSGEQCKYTKPAGSSENYCFSECYTPSCCEKLNCSSDQTCDTNKYDSSQCICENKPIKEPTDKGW